MANTENHSCAYCSGTGLMQSFRCNICGEESVKHFASMERDIPSCFSCGSTVRLRAMMRALSEEIYGRNLLMNDFPRRPDIFGLGMTDWDNYSNILPRKINYINTFYDKEPRLDITDTNLLFENALDFLISSDVFEHVAQPVSVAFENAFRMLKRNGVLVFSVPYLREGTPTEYFPELNKYEIVQEGDKRKLKNVTRDGRTQVFDNLVFHGCDALEMRTFSEASILEDLTKAGFQEIAIYDDLDFEHGLVFRDNQAVPMAARKRSTESNNRSKIIRMKDVARLSKKSVKTARCKACNGKGNVAVAKPEQICGRCNGTGSIQSGMCPACSGFGWMDVVG